MNPTEINILIAILATVFGIAIRHVWGYFYLDSRALDLLDNWEDAYPKDVADSYTTGFRAGVQMADDEEAEDELEEEDHLSPFKFLGVNEAAYAVIERYASSHKTQ